MIEVSRGRGLDDLMADHERELPFLDAYASNSHEGIETQITRMLGQPDSKGWSQGVMAIDASTLTVRVTSPAALPLVVSDLHVEGFTKATSHRIAGRLMPESKDGPLRSSGSWNAWLNSVPWSMGHSRQRHHDGDEHHARRGKEPLIAGSGAIGTIEGPCIEVVVALGPRAVP